MLMETGNRACPADSHSFCCLQRDFFSRLPFGLGEDDDLAAVIEAIGAGEHIGHGANQRTKKRKSPSSPNKLYTELINLFPVYGICIFIKFKAENKYAKKEV